MKNKIKIMNTKPEITDDEIRSYMDFDKVLLQNAKKPAVKNDSHIVRNIVIITTCVGIICCVWFFTHPDYRTPESGISAKSSPGNADQPIKHKSDSILIDDKKTKIDDRQKNIEERQTETTSSEVKQTESLEPVTPSASLPENIRSIERDSTVAISESKDVSLLSPVYTQPEPVGGYPELYEYFSRELKYPEVALSDSVQGVVSVVFTINTSGRPEKITIEQSLGEAFDLEAIRLIENMPQWKPATYNGNPVSSKISLPITFRFKKLTPKE